MKSYAHIERHPIHPMLIPFPIAFLLGALLFDFGSMLLPRREWAITGFHLLQLGIGAGLIAAVPGLLDYWKRVPPRSKGAKRAVRNGIANVAALALFAGAWYLRRRGIVTPMGLGLEIAGAAVLTYSGWLGGVLVSRNLYEVRRQNENVLLVAP